MFFKKKQSQSLNNIMLKNKNSTLYGRTKRLSPFRKVIGLFLFLLILSGLVVSIYFIVKKLKKNKHNKSKSDETLNNHLNNLLNNTNIKEEEEEEEEEEDSIDNLINENRVLKDKKEVYSVHTNQWEYDDAEAVCKLEDPEAELATYEQLVEAAKNGAHWCNLGWIKSDKTTNEDDETRRAHFPIQKTLFNKTPDKCGLKWNNSDNIDFAETDHALQGGLYNKNTNKFGVNCYGVKRTITDDEKWLLRQKFEKDPKLESAMKRVRAIKGEKPLLLHPYQGNQWSKYD
jgi:hypothetical protein